MTEEAKIELTLDNALQIVTYAYYRKKLIENGFTLEEANELINVKNKLETHAPEVQDLFSKTNKYLSSHDKKTLIPDVDGGFIMLDTIYYLLKEYNAADKISLGEIDREYKRYIIHTSAKIIQNLINKGNSIEEAVKILNLQNTLKIRKVEE